MIEKIEKGIFFRFTRIFAWLIILPAFLALVYSGYKVMSGFRAGSKSLSVTYEEVNNAMAENKNTGDKKGKEGKQSALKEEKVEDKYEKEIKEMVDALAGVNMALMEQVERVVVERISNEDKKDRDAYVQALLAVKKGSSGDKLVPALDTLDSIWHSKKEARDMEAASKKADSMMLLSILGGSFAAISIFSLLLVLLSIEKNTRREAEK